MADPMAMPALGQEAQFGFGGGASDPYLMMLMRRRAMAEALQRQQSQQPMTHPLQVLGSIAQQGVGAWQQDRAEREYLDYFKGQNARRAALLAEALREPQGAAPAAGVGMAAPPAQAAPSAGPSGAPVPLAATDMTPGQAAFLDRLSRPESGGRYDVMYGGNRFDPAMGHPNNAVPITTGPDANSGKNSTAAGRYQFIYPTWQSASAAAGVDPKDFSPASQDRVAWAHAASTYKGKTGRDLLADVSSEDPAVRAGIDAALRDQWPSLPGGSQSRALSPAPAAPAQSAATAASPADPRTRMAAQAERLMRAAILSNDPQLIQQAAALAGVARAQPEPPNWQTANIGGQVVAFNPRNPSQMIPLGTSNDRLPETPAQIEAKRAISAPHPELALPPEVEAQRRRLGAPHPAVAATPEHQAQQMALRPPMTLSPGQSAFRPDGQAVASVPSKPTLHNVPPGHVVLNERGDQVASAPDRAQDFTRANTLRDEYTKLTADFRTLQDAHRKIQSAASANTGAGDMSMLYSFVKMLDPGSVVRESEFAMAAAAGSFGERIQGAAQRFLDGQRMAPSLRAEFLAEARGIMNAQRGAYDQYGKIYRDLAKRANLNPDDVVTDQVIPSGTDAPIAPASPVGARPAATPDNPLGLVIPQRR